MSARCLALAALLAALLVIAGCGARSPGAPGGERDGVASVASQRPYPPYQPDRRDYASFREANPELLEPNYLPFMVHRFESDAAVGDALVFCRWFAGGMPIAVYIEPPVIAAALQDEFNPRRPEDYVEAVAESLGVWERELEGLVSFRRVDEPAAAALTLRIVGEEGPVPVADRQRLGVAEALQAACRSYGWDGEAQRMLVRFELPMLVIHLADERGLLPPSLVRRIAIHELGHALGMRGHSPSRGDVMYPVLSDAPGHDELSLQDVNSFLSLYRLPNGAHLADLPPGGPAARLPPAPPSGAPMLAMAPHVDARRGFELHLPAGWLRIEEPRGLFIANGPSWDYDVSLRIFVWPSPSIEDFLRCCSRGLLAGSWFRERAFVVVKGRRALKLRVEDAEGRLAQQYLFIELGDGRVMMIAAESPVEYEQAWQPWFQVCLNSLEIWPPVGAGTPGSSER